MKHATINSIAIGILSAALLYGEFQINETREEADLQRELYSVVSDAILINLVEPCQKLCGGNTCWLGEDYNLTCTKSEAIKVYHKGEWITAMSFDPSQLDRKIINEHKTGEFDIPKHATQQTGTYKSLLCIQGSDPKPAATGAEDKK